MDWLKHDSFMVKVTSYLYQEHCLDVCDLDYDQQILTVNIINGCKGIDSVNNAAGRVVENLKFYFKENE